MAKGAIKTAKKRSKQGKMAFSDGLVDEATFLDSHGISKAQFTRTKIQWSDLQKIHAEFVTIRADMERLAIAIASILLGKNARDKGVHSVRYRIKEANSLVEKVIRDRIKNPNRALITTKNYRARVTDLIGIRVLHTFQNDHGGIHDFLKETFVWKRKPIAYYKEGDPADFRNACATLGCVARKHGKGYRSVHYIIATQLTKEVHYAEVQVRTIYQEGWSEIDHKMRYSDKLSATDVHEPDLNDLNTASSHADSLATKLKRRHDEVHIKPGKWKTTGGKDQPSKKTPPAKPRS